MTDPAMDRSHADAEHGIAASVAAPRARPLVVAPTTGLEFNAVELDLTPRACLLLRDAVFAFDSSFVKPTAGKARVADLLARLEPLRRRHQDSSGQLPLLSVFGHADPVGNDAYNKRLSGRRAQAVFALLLHRVDLWQRLHDEPFGGDDWSRQGTLDVMRRALGLSAAPPRAELFERYMTSLFPTRLSPTDFLGRGADADGKADFQGCGELNPVLLLSAAQNRAFAAPAQRAARDAANEPNRRVLIHLFPAAAAPSVQAWPCPRAGESDALCRRRLFADAGRRRAAGVEQREFADGGDTFACRFYQRIAQGSPCEARRAGSLAVRVVPPTFARAGNVIAALERVDGRPLPTVETIALGSREIGDAFAAPDGRIYFRPPTDADDVLTQGSLETGQPLQLVDAARYVTEPRAAAVALREQMAVLRQFVEQLIAFGRENGNTGEETRSVFCAAVGDGHLRFSQAIQRLAGSPEPEVRLTLAATARPAASGGDAVDDALAGFHDEHGDALDSVGASLPPQPVES